MLMGWPTTHLGCTSSCSLRHRTPQTKIHKKTKKLNLQNTVICLQFAVQDFLNALVTSKTVQQNKTIQTIEVKADAIFTHQSLQDALFLSLALFSLSDRLRQTNSTLSLYVDLKTSAISCVYPAHSK